MIPPLKYLMQELNGNRDFTVEWRKLSEPDKETLKRWAEEEMAITRPTA